MEKIAASRVKQNFGEALAKAAHGPIGVEKHGRLVAGLVPPQWLERTDALDERRTARSAQRGVELGRLMNHQRLGIALLCAAAPMQRRLIASAREEVGRWEELQLCSDDYIAMWREWLALPVKELVQVMCSEADGWGSAMRQNSPFSASSNWGAD